MRKILFYLTILFTYVIVLGHNLVPHTHHNEHTEHENDHVHHQHAHHDHHDNKTENEEEEENSLAYIFAHLFHSPHTASVEYTLIQPSENDVLNMFQASVFVVAESYLSVIIFRDQNDPPDIRNSFYSSLSLRHLSLRAPPVC